MSAMLNPVPRPAAPAQKRPALRVLPSTRQEKANGLIFGLIMVAILGLSMFGQQMINTKIQQMQFAVSAQAREDQALADKQDQLASELSRTTSTSQLAQAASSLGMVPAGAVGYVNPDGSVTGNPQPATAQDYKFMKTSQQLEAEARSRAEAIAAAKKAEEAATAKKKAEEEAAKKPAAQPSAAPSVPAAAAAPAPAGR